MFKTKSILVHLRDTSIGKVCDHIQLGLFNESDTDFDNPKAQITNRKYWLNCVQAVVVSGRSLPYWMIQTLLAYSIMPLCPPPHFIVYVTVDENTFLNLNTVPIPPNVLDRGFSLTLRNTLDVLSTTWPRRFPWICSTAGMTKSTKMASRKLETGSTTKTLCSW